MQIPPFNPVNLLSPLVEPPAIPPVAAVGTGMQAEGMQTNAQGHAPDWFYQQAGEINLKFPSERSADVEESLRALAEAMQPANLELNFSRDDATGTIVIKLVDQTTGEAVQQIPAEALLRLSASLGKLQGQLFDQQA